MRSLPAFTGLLSLSAAGACARDGWTRSLCPTTCSGSGYATQDWDVYTSVDRLLWCNQTMLVAFNIHNPIDSPNTQTRLAVCTVDADETGPGIGSREDRGHRRNSPPHITRKDSTPQVPETSSLQNSSATVQVKLLKSKSASRLDSSAIVRAANGVRQYVESLPQQAETIMFAYDNGAVAGLYSGAKMKAGAWSDITPLLLQELTSSNPATAAAQVCSDGRNADYSLGMICVASRQEYASESLALVQQAVASWQQSTCLELTDSTKSVSTKTIGQVAQTPLSVIYGSETAQVSQGSAVCSAIQVVSGDSCSSLVSAPLGVAAVSLVSVLPATMLMR